MQNATQILQEFGIPFEARVVSAHRMPDDMFEYAATALERGLRCIIAGAGGAAHLPGMVASLTPLPVIGVPVESKSLKGLDSLLSIAQMPDGVPVAAMAIGGGKNAGLMAVIQRETQSYDGEVLFIHGDTHRYRVDQPLLDLKTRVPVRNFTRLEVHGYPFMNWVRVRVSTQGKRVTFAASPGQ